MRYPALCELLRKWKYHILLVLIALFDMMLCIPTTACVIVKPFSNETWTAAHRSLELSINIHIGTTVLLGTLIVGIMRCMTGLQIGILIFTRLYSIALLLELKSDEDYGLKIIIGIVTAFSLIHIVVHGWFAAKCGELKTLESGNCCPCVSKTWFPAGVITSALLLFVHLLTENSGFSLLYYALYVFGFEVMVASAYFCTIYDTITKKKDDACYNTGIQDGKQQVVFKDPDGHQTLINNSV